VLLWMAVFSDVALCTVIVLADVAMDCTALRVQVVRSSATSGNLTQDPLSPLRGPGSSNLHSCMWSNTTRIALLSHVAVDCASDSTWSVWSVTTA
jgi:hypothetical protein